MNIFLLNLPILLLQHILESSSSPLPFWARLLLLSDSVVEFPLIFAFHPTTLTYGIYSDTPVCFSISRGLLLQISIYFALELLTQHCIKRFIASPDTSTPQGQAVGGPLDQLSNDDHKANAIALELMSPSAALLVATALIGTPSVTHHVGQLHPGALVGWTTLRQIAQLIQSSIGIKKLVETGQGMVRQVSSYAMAKCGLKARSKGEARSRCTK